MTTKYIARLDGRIVGNRTTKERTYTHAIVINGHRYTDHVVAWSGSHRLAQDQQRKYQRYGYRADIVVAEPVAFVCAGQRFNDRKAALAHAEHLFKTTGVVAGVELA